MGKLESINKVRVRKRNLQKIILQTVSTVGVVGVALVAPEVVKAMKKLGLIPHLRQQEYISSSASKLAKRGLLTFDGKRYKLTRQGETILEKWEVDDFKINKPKKWDGKWRLIISDISESKKPIRDRIREIFKNSGFERLQNSVWVYPYDCEDVLTLLKTEYMVGKNILYIIADEIENDRHLRENFGLI